jgi:hypothetical protein
MLAIQGMLLTQKDRVPKGQAPLAIGFVERKVFTLATSRQQQQHRNR